MTVEPINVYADAPGVQLVIPNGTLLDNVRSLIESSGHTLVGPFQQLGESMPTYLVELINPIRVLPREPQEVVPASTEGGA